MLRAIASITRWRMKNAVLRLTPHLSAVLRRVSPSTWHCANLIQTSRGSLEAPKTLLVAAVKVLPQPRHSHLCAPPAVFPLLTVCSQPHLGQAAAPSPPFAARSKISSSMMRRSSLSASRLSLSGIRDRDSLAMVAISLSMPPTSSFSSVTFSQRGRTLDIRAIRTFVSTEG